MTDREGNKYGVFWTVDRDDQGVESRRPVCVMSPSRQRRKALGLSGRQWVKYRKALRLRTI